MNPKALIATVALGAAVVIPTSAALAGRDTPRVAFSGTATTTDQGWRFALAGTAAGKPFDGPMYGSIRTQTGVWPADGACVNGDVRIFVDGPDRKELTLVTVGEVCRMSNGSETFFVGQFDTYDSHPNRLNDIQGSITVHLPGDGRALVAAVEVG